MKPLKFMQWLYARRDEDTPIGDLANDAKRAKVPSGGGLITLRRSMVNNQASLAAWETYEDAKRLYLLYKRGLEE